MKLNIVHLKIFGCVIYVDLCNLLCKELDD